MEIYLVGGAIRDELLGLPIKERDWLVVGATPQDLLARGYKQVGKDFPVFLHPETHEEYALARTERKTAPGYHGFVFETDPTVRLEDDLIRRDLTINTLVRNAQGQLIDKYGGLRDLAQRWLRHVSPAFAEDPVRILRVARFAARFMPLGFRIAPETMSLMRDMVATREVDALVPERVWTETVRALGERQPRFFIEVLRECGALAKIFPEIDQLFGVPQPAHHHPEIDTGLHTLLALDQAVAQTSDPKVRFAVLMHDVGKGTTPPDQWPRHRGHEQRGGELVRAFSARLRIPRDYRNLAILVAEYHTHCHRALELRPGTLLNTLQALDAFRKTERFEQFLMACEADAHGRIGFETSPYPQADYLRMIYHCIKPVPVQPLLQKGLTGSTLGLAIRHQRLKAMIAAIRDWRNAQKDRA